MLYVVAFRVFNFFPYSIRKKIKTILYSERMRKEKDIVENTKLVNLLYKKLKEKNAHRY